MVDMLFVVSTAGAWTLKDGTKHPTGYCGEELAISEAGWEISIATPGAMAPTLDDLSVGILAGTPSNRRRIRDYLALIQDNLDRPIALDQAAADDYGLVFYPGGHGPMEDLAVDPVSGALLTGRLASGKPLALLCHAPAALLAATSKVGTWPFASYRMTALSNIEERLNTFSWKAKWFLEDALKVRGATSEKATLPLRPFVVADRNLYTGRNPQSADSLANRIIADITTPIRPTG